MLTLGREVYFLKIKSTDGQVPMPVALDAQGRRLKLEVNSSWSAWAT